MTLTRRQFLKGGALLGSSAVAAPLLGHLARVSAGGPSLGTGYGPLSAVEDAATGLRLLRLPPQFRYVSLGWTGDTMSDGRATPQNHDGMAVVHAEGDRLTLVRNHEIAADRGALGPADLAYDSFGSGGTTNLVFDTRAERLVRDWVSLSGTVINCSGGPTPWGTWISCEETTVGPDGGFDIDHRPLNLRLRRKHGYCFEVRAEGVTRAEPITAMGRFLHEAVAIDPKTGICYQTEDNLSCGFYRYVPREPGRLLAGGALQMFAVTGHADLSGGFATGTTFDGYWVDVDEPDRAHTPGKRDHHGVYSQGKARGGCTFARLEGCWHGQERIFFTSTTGGRAGRGQVWAYAPEAQTLELVFESPGGKVLDHCDNLATSRRGGLLLCEDGGRSRQRLIGLGADGEPFVFAENDVRLRGQRNQLSGDFRRSEWAGACFSPDGEWLFVNVQVPGITLAITGPWQPGLI